MRLSQAPAAREGLGEGWLRRVRSRFILVLRPSIHDRIQHPGVVVPNRVDPAADPPTPQRVIGRRPEQISRPLIQPGRPEEPTVSARALIGCLPSSLLQCGIKPQRSRSSRRSLVSWCQRITGTLLVGAMFQLGALIGTLPEVANRVRIRSIGRSKALRRDREGLLKPA